MAFHNCSQQFKLGWSKLAEQSVQIPAEEREGMGTSICRLFQCNNYMRPNEAGRSKVQANKLGQSLHTAVDLGSFPQLALAPKLMPALGWGT